jgi:hypothetical protein
LNDGNVDTNTVVIRIQHALGRDAPLKRLLAQLPQNVEVITDEEVDDPNPWRNYKRCLSNLPDCSHIVVLQDDVIVCRNFVAAVERIVRARPDQPICLFVGGLPRQSSMAVLKALSRNERYSTLYWRDFCPVVAMLWPVEVVHSFLEWSTTAKLPGVPDPRSDDAVVGRWMAETRQQILATAPCLVQHPDDVESTIKRPHRDGRDRGRVAVAWIGDADPLELDWS